MTRKKLIDVETFDRTGGDVLPGFKLPVTAVFADPLADSLADTAE